MACLLTQAQVARIAPLLLGRAAAEGNPIAGLGSGTAAGAQWLSVGSFTGRLGQVAHHVHALPALVGLGTNWRNWVRACLIVGLGGKSYRLLRIQLS